MRVKKFYVSSLFISLVVIFVCCQAVFADSFGTLSTTLKKGQWMMSVEGYSAVNRDLKYSDGSVESTYWGIYHGRGYGLTDRINVFAKVGYHDLRINPNPFKNEEESLKGGMAGGFYLKGIILKEPENLFELGIGGGFLYCMAHQNNGPKYDWREWQIGTYAGKKFGRFAPYCGIKYADADASLKFKQKEEDLLAGSINVESDNKIGVFAGTNVYLNEDEDVYLNCEVNFISSIEIGAGLYYKF